MAKPTILAVDDDPGASRAIARDLSTRYGADYSVVRATSGAEALTHLARLAPAGPAGGPGRLRPADAGDDRHRDARGGAQPVPGLQAAPAHRVRGHRRRDQGDQRHRPRLLPRQAVGPALGAALPGHRRAARRLEQRPPAGDPGGPGGGPPVGGAHLRGQDLPHPQPRALPLAGRRARRRGPPAARPGRSRRPRPGAAAGRRHAVGHRAGAPSNLELAGALGLRDPGAAAALRPLHRRVPARRGSRPRCTRRPRACRRWSSSGTPRAARPGRARRSRTTSASRGACPART